jgi:MinD-like ATPase involved in chromosome partitioning or flagellar assembly
LTDLWGSDRVRIAFAAPSAVEERLAFDAERHGHEVVARCSSALDLAARLQLERVEVAVVQAGERYLSSVLIEACDSAGVRVLALAADASERRAVAALGLVEVADASCTWAALEQLLHPDETRSASRPSVPSRGSVIAVWGPAGAPGRTTIAVNLAAEIAAAGHSVALADVDTYSGSVAPTLGMLDEAPGFAAACRLASASALTLAEFERIGERYVSGHGNFWVLTGIGRPSRWPELSASRVESTIAACRTWVDFTVIDAGFSFENDEEISSDMFAPRRNAATIAALGAADIVVAVGAADPVGLSRFLRAHVDLVETIAAPRVLVVMNKVRASAIGLNPVGQVAQTLSRFGGIESAAMIPFDHAALDAALLSGKTLADAAPKSPARVSIRDLAQTRILQNTMRRRRGRRAR